MALPQVQLSRNSLVKPERPTKRHILYLSVCDQLLRYCRPNRTILFYKTDITPAVAAESLKRGLSSVLVAFYPLAGRLIVENDGKFALDCNDEGVEFVEAHTDLAFAEFEDSKYEIRKFFRDLTGLDDRETSCYTDGPLASIQITTFVGGLTIGIAISHLLVDGYAFWVFIRSFAQVCRGEIVSTQPLHLRTLLKPDNLLLNRVVEEPSLDNHPTTPENGTIPGSNDATGNGNGTHHLVHGATEDGSPRHKYDWMSVKPEDLHQRTLHITKDMLETLKRVSGEGREETFSSFEALAAYCWKRQTAAQRLDDSTKADFRAPLDVRTRIIPPLTAAYFGNAIVAVVASTTAGELTKESLGETAARIRKAVKEVDDKYLKTTMIGREKLDMRTLVKGSNVMFMIRNASKFGVYESGDFGWGKPEAVRPPWGWREGNITWYPGKEGNGSIDVVFSFSTASMASFFSPERQALDPLGDQLF